MFSNTSKLVAMYLVIKIRIVGHLSALLAYCLFGWFGLFLFCFHGLLPSPHTPYKKYISDTEIT